MTNTQSCVGASARSNPAPARLLHALVAFAGVLGVLSCSSDNGEPSEAGGAGGLMRAGAGNVQGGAGAAGSSHAGGAGARAGSAGSDWFSDSGGAGAVSNSDGTNTGGDADGGNAGDAGRTGGAGDAGSAGDDGAGGADATTDNGHRWLYYLTASGADYAVYLMDLRNSGYPRTLLPGAQRPAFSPDGHWLADTTATALELRDLSGAHLGESAAVATGAVGQLAWSTDSQWIAFISGSSDLWVYRVSTGTTFHLTDKASVGSTVIDFVASRWGTRLVFGNSSHEASYVDLANASPTNPPSPVIFATGFNTTGYPPTGWVGDEYFALDAMGLSQTNRYAHFDASGLESSKAFTLTISQSLFSNARNPSPPTITLGSAYGYAPQAWFRFDTSQLVEWPVIPQTDSPFLAYAPDCARFAVQTDTSTVQVFDAAKAKEAPIASLPVAGVLPTTEDYVWSPDGQVLASQWNAQIRVTSFNPAVLTQTIPGDYPSSNDFFWRIAFGAQHDWVSFQSFVSGDETTPATFFRWFSAVDGTGPQPPQKFPTTNGSLPSESPDHRQIAMLSDVGIAVTTLSHGTFAPLRALLPLSRDALLSVGHLTWARDSRHVATVTNASNTNYVLHVVDTVSDPPESVDVLTLNGAYELQP